MSERLSTARADKLRHKSTAREAIRRMNEVDVSLGNGQRRRLTTHVAEQNKMFVAKLSKARDEPAFLSRRKIRWLSFTLFQPHLCLITASASGHRIIPAECYTGGSKSKFFKVCRRVAFTDFPGFPQG
jgi:hypothetical protein